jgi:hypothetical protein
MSRKRIADIWIDLPAVVFVGAIPQTRHRQPIARRLVYSNA